MTTLIINEKSKAAKLFLDYAKSLPFVIADETSRTEFVKTKKAEIELISKKINKTGTKKMFEKLGLDYDSYSR